MKYGRAVPAIPSLLTLSTVADRQVDMLYRSAPPALAFSYFGTLMSLAVLHDIGDTQRGLFWFAFATWAMLFRGGLAWLYLEESLHLKAQTWARLMIFGNFLAGIQWALLGTWLFPTEPSSALYPELFLS